MSDRLARVAPVRLRQGLHGRARGVSFGWWEVVAAVDAAQFGVQPVLPEPALAPPGSVS